MIGFLENGDFVELVHKAWLTKEGTIVPVEDWNKDFQWEGIEKQLLPLYKLRVLTDARSDNGS